MNTNTNAARYIVIASKGKNDFSPVTKQFENDGVEMQKFIELKAKAGFICHKYDYSASFNQESRIIQTT